MDLNFEAVRSGLAAAQRYRFSEETRFSNCRGLQAYDVVLERDVELLQMSTAQDEFLAEVRARFIMEAKIGALGHPHIPPTLDLGTMTDDKAGEQLFFTRPLVPIDLHSKFRWLFIHAADLEIMDLLEEHNTYWISRDYFDRRRQTAADFLQESISKRWVLETRRSKRLRPKSLALPTDADTTLALKQLDARLADVEGDAKRYSWSEAQHRRQIEFVTRYSFDELLYATFRLNNLRQANMAEQERLVVLNLSNLIAALLAVCDAIDFAHRHDVIHLHLSPKTIGFGMVDDHVYLTHWHQVHVAGAPWEPETASWPIGGIRTFWPTVDVNPGTYDLPGCTGLGPKTDVFSLGGILSYLLHELPGERGNEAPLQLRSIYSPGSKTISADIREKMSRLEKVAQRALEFDPASRQQSAADFAAEIQSAMGWGASRTGFSSVSDVDLAKAARDEARKDECARLLQELAGDLPPAADNQICEVPKYDPELFWENPPKLIRDWHCFSVGIVNCLFEAGIETIDQLCDPQLCGSHAHVSTIRGVTKIRPDVPSARTRARTRGVGVASVTAARTAGWSRNLRPATRSNG